MFLLLSFLLFFFFFQAEDGIRDAQESRGLGDVYKRQVYSNSGKFIFGSTDAGDRLYRDGSDIKLYLNSDNRLTTVSYTHLTLPTIYSV